MDMDELTIKTRDLVTFTEAATILGVSRPTLYNLVKQESLHPVLIGNNRYLLRAEVEKLKLGAK
jgi:excisionase family DNA binding protein